MSESFTIEYGMASNNKVDMETLRALIMKSHHYGRPMILDGILSKKVQIALLKTAEEIPSKILIKSEYRLIRELEARASSITGKCNNMIDPRLAGLAAVNPKFARAATEFLETFEVK